MDKDIKEYLDLKFKMAGDAIKSVKDDIRTIKAEILAGFNHVDSNIKQVAEKNNDNYTEIEKIKLKLENGQKAFDHIREELKDIPMDQIKDAIEFVKGFKKMLWAIILGLLGSGGIAGLIIYFVIRAVKGG